MVEWFPRDAWHDLAGVTILVAFPFFLFLIALLWWARPSEPVSRRLAFFLLLTTAYQITWLNSIVEVSSRLSSALYAVNVAASSIDAGAYLAFIATALGWRMARSKWFIPAIVAATLPFLVAAILLFRDYWDSPWGVTSQAIWMALYTFGFVYAFVRWRRAKQPGLRRQYALYSIALGAREVFFILQTGARVIWNATDDRVWLEAQQAIASLGHVGLLVMGVVLAYAMLRHHLFDLNLRLHWTISRGAIVSVFIAVFTMVSLGTSEFLLDELGYVAGAVATGGLLFAVRPLQGFADRIASRAVPDTRPPNQRDLKERLAFYQEQVEIAFRDGYLSPNELVMLDTMRDRLHLSAADVRPIQRRVTAGM